VMILLQYDGSKSGSMDSICSNVLTAKS